ncbi:META domain-containing protein [Hymenobacter psychrophilus]|uniref:Heat shock protein HslJ n=1 Tax=Hymenobacter psychrophilus TaxID=651662 RepID=A0A1H3EZF3_9BACT|nr:META domain-containing protein [Hymenobacter psychrophilus]SDX84183.1 Heat shock protein HslJ [Hymenobacter psychrophilus]
MFRFAPYVVLTALALTGCTAKTTEPVADASGRPTTPVAAATAVMPDAAALTGEWHIRTLNGAELPAEAASTAALSFDTTTNKVSGSTGCNRLMGTYTTSGAGITFGPLATTRMACPPNSPEAGLMTALGSKTLTYQLSTDMLTLLDGTTAVVTLSR